MAIGSLKNRGASTGKSKEEPSTTEQVGSTVGQIGGQVAGQHAMGQLMTPAAQTAQVAQVVPMATNAAGQAVIPAGQAIPAGYVGIGTDAVTQGTIVAQGQAATGLPTSVLGGIGPVIGLGGMAYAAGQNFKQDGGIEALKGKGSSQQNIDAIANSNPVTGWINPVTKTLGLGTIGEKFGGKGTAEYKAERLAGLDPRLQQHIGRIEASNQEAVAASGDKEGYWSARTDPTGKYVGQKWSWEAEKDIAQQTGNYNGIIGAIGNNELYGEKWVALSQEQQEEIVKRNLTADAYVSDMGSVIFHKSKKDIAQKNFDDVVAGNPPQTNQAPQDGQPQAQQGDLVNNTKAANAPILNSLSVLTNRERPYQGAGQAQTLQPAQNQVVTPSEELPGDMSGEGVSPILANPVFGELKRSYYGQ